MDEFVIEYQEGIYILSHRVGYCRDIIGRYHTREEAKAAMYAAGKYSSDTYPSVRSVDGVEVFTFPGKQPTHL